MTIKTMIWVIGFIVAYVIITSLWGFYWAIRPPFKLASTITPANLGLKYEEISFYTADHILIKGWFIPARESTTKTIILLHGYPADKGDILPSRLFLHEKYNLLLMDFRYLGQSGGHYTTIGQKEVLDLVAAIQYLKTRHINDVGVWGLSLGGAVALMTAKDSPAIRAIVSESSYASLDKMLFEYYPTPLFQYPLAWLTRFWGNLLIGIDIHDVSPSKSAAELQIPILILHSKADTVVPFEHAELLKQALQNNPKAQFLFSERLHHGELSPEVIAEIEAFFAKNL